MRQQLLLPLDLELFEVVTWIIMKHVTTSYSYFNYLLKELIFILVDQSLYKKQSSKNNYYLFIFNDKVSSPYLG